MNFIARKQAHLRKLDKIHNIDKNVFNFELASKC